MRHILLKILRYLFENKMIFLNEEIQILMINFCLGYDLQMTNTFWLSIKNTVKVTDVIHSSTVFILIKIENLVCKCLYQTILEILKPLVIDKSHLWYMVLREDQVS